MPIVQNPLTAFQQYGYKENKEENGHSVGNCVFCGRENKFYINLSSQNKAWDCKVCGKSGGYQKFLQHVVEMSCATTDDDLDVLAKDRKLKVETLRKMCVGVFNQKFIVPVFSHDKKMVMNIKIYDGESFRNTAGCTAAMYNLWNIPKDDTQYTTVYLTEGEWDTLAMLEILDTLKREDEIVIGVPGAGTFKQEAINYFVGKHVYLLYDNDVAGVNGTKKAVSLLSTVASKIEVLKWPSGIEEGFDVRDVYTKMNNRKAKQTLEWLRGNCARLSLDEQENSENAVDVETHTSPIDVKEVYDTFKRWIHIGDNKEKDQKGTDIYDVVFGTILANRIEGSPVWMYIVAPPGGYKSEPLLACAGGKLIEMVESVTPAALISGMSIGGHSDPSLISRINRKTLLIKDWTIILGLPEHERNEIMSILRGAFDGMCGRNFGNGVRREIKSTFGILAAVTPVIEQYIEETSAVGERFISWRNWLSEDQNVRKAHIRRALENTLTENDMKLELNAIAKRVLIAQYPAPPHPSKAVIEQVISMSEWIAKMRGIVVRDKYTKAILHKPCHELGTRVSKELLKWLMGVTLFKGESEISEDSMRIAQAIARSSVSQRNLLVLQAMYKDKEKLYTRKEVATAIDFSAETTDLLLGNLVALKVLESKLIDNTMHYKIKSKFITLTEEAKVL